MASAENRLIACLPRKDRLHLLAACKPFQLQLSSVLCDAGTRARHAYFPVDGFISMVTPIDGKPALEVGMVGREGMLGTHLALGVSTVPLHALVQGEGTAWRITASALRAELARSVALQRVLNRYLYVQLAHLAGSAACLRFHEIGPRLARWLLMSHDRANADHFRLTQEFLAYMLGVRRVGITAAASALQKSGVIDYHRGEIVVLDRKGLESAACACYSVDRRAYADVLG